MVKSPTFECTFENALSRLAGIESWIRRDVKEITLESWKPILIVWKLNRGYTILLSQSSLMTGTLPAAIK